MQAQYKREEGFNSLVRARYRVRPMTCSSAPCRLEKEMSLRANILCCDLCGRRAMWARDEMGAVLHRGHHCRKEERRDHQGQYLPECCPWVLVLWKTDVVKAGSGVPLKVKQKWVGSVNPEKATVKFE